MNASPTPTRSRMLTSTTAVSSVSATPYASAFRWRVYSGSVSSARPLARMSPNWYAAPVVIRRLRWPSTAQTLLARRARAQRVRRLPVRARAPAGIGRARPRERHAEREQQPRGGVFEEVGVGPRVQHQRGEARRHRDPRRSAPRAPEEHREGAREQRHVDREADDPLLGRDRHGDRVRRRRRVLDVAAAVALVLRFEGSRAVALERALREQFEPAADERRAPA